VAAFPVPMAPLLTKCFCQWTGVQGQLEKAQVALKVLVMEDGAVPSSTVVKTWIISIV